MEAELNMVAAGTVHTETVYLLADSQPSITNRAQCKATSLIGLYMLLLRDRKQISVKSKNSL